MRGRKENKWVSRAVLAAVVLLLVGGFLYLQSRMTVDSSQQAVVYRFGDYTRTITEPGQYLKVPFIDRVTYLPSQPISLDVPPATVRTMDKGVMVVISYASGLIVDPRLTLEAVGDEDAAAARAREIIRTEMRKEVARRDKFDAAKNRDEVLALVREAVRPQLEELGIELIKLNTNLSQ